MLAVRKYVGRNAAFALAASAAFVGSMSLAAPTNAAMPGFDGVWSVLIVTEKGDCDRGYRYPIRISHGVLANGGSSSFTISGHVGPTGAITVMVSNGSRSAKGSGRLAGNSGQGSWTGGACSGTWTAERRSS